MWNTKERAILERGEDLMDVRESVVSVSAYFFEVLVKEFLELEKKIAKNAGILSIFKKINYMDRATAFKGLVERAIEAESNLPSSEKAKSDYDLYSLASKLTECFALFINMTEAQVIINAQLNQKANGGKYNWDEYTKNLKNFEMWRNSLEAELPKLNALYSRTLSKIDNESAPTNEEVDEKQLAYIVIEEHLRETNANFDRIMEFLHEYFNVDDLASEEWIKYDFFLCGSTLDSMALFNLLDKQQANRLYHYISVEKFSDMEDKDLANLIISEISEYKRLFDKSVEESEPPFDYLLSKLLKNVLGENIDKYNIGPMLMIQLMSLVMPMYVGKWKRALEECKLV